MTVVMKRSQQHGRRGQRINTRQTGRQSMSRIPAGICANFKIDEHRFSTIGNDHGLYNIVGLTSNFSVQEKCNRKMDCLIYEMLFLRKKKPNLNTQSDSIRANLFV